MWFIEAQENGLIREAAQFKTQVKSENKNTQFLCLCIRTNIYFRSQYSKSTIIIFKHRLKNNAEKVK